MFLVSNVRSLQTTVMSESENNSKLDSDDGNESNTSNENKENLGNDPVKHTYFLTFTDLDSKTKGGNFCS